VIVTAVLVALAFVVGWFGNGAVNQLNQMPANDPYGADIVQSYRAIVDHYVDVSSINRQKMAYAAMRAMVDSLGDTGHSRFETPQEVQQENSQLQNANLHGIGVELNGGGNQPLRILEVFPGSAADGHLLPGDVIVAVNGKNIKGLTLDQVRTLIVGPDGTPVTLTIQRQGAAKPLIFTLTRKAFTVPLVATYIIPGVNLADIQLTEFGENPNSQADSTDGELRAAIRQALARHVSGIILDLRDNPGGYLDQAVLASSEFIPAGSGHNVYIQESRSGRTPEAVDPGGLATSTPLAILVNNGTASAAEITTAAIQYAGQHGFRPPVHVIGEHTFGTHTILEPITLADGSVLLLGTQAWLTPSGQNVRNTGILPDQPVALPNAALAITPLVAQEEHLTGAQVLSGSDAQLNQAIHDLTH
jgi:carboxyl-terminal processing protease